MGFFLFGSVGIEGLKRPTGGLRSYRQVKPWKKRDMMGEIVRFTPGFASAQELA
jgi:hypothetical protein